MALKPAICTQCGGQIEVDDSKEAGICQFCGTAFITEKVIHQFVTQNNFAGATFNIQGGVDIENLYTLARRAVEANNKDDVLKYYGQIRERDPNDWESTFFYAWFENGENFEKYFQTTEDLILKLDSGKKFEALNRLYTFFKNIKFTFEVAYGETSPFPLKNQDLYYDFVKKLFEEKNTEIINIAGNLTYFMEFWKGQKKFYLDILSTQDKTYLPYLKEFHWRLSPGKPERKGYHIIVIVGVHRIPDQASPGIAKAHADRHVVVHPPVLAQFHLERRSRIEADIPGTTANHGCKKCVANGTTQKETIQSRVLVAKGINRRTETDIGSEIVPIRGFHLLSLVLCHFRRAFFFGIAKYAVFLIAVINSSRIKTQIEN